MRIYRFIEMTQIINTSLIIGLGGFIGTILRFLISSSIEKTVTTSFPIGTVLVNLIGCFFDRIGFWLFHSKTRRSNAIILFSHRRNPRRIYNIFSNCYGVTIIHREWRISKDDILHSSSGHTWHYSMFDWLQSNKELK